MAHFRFDRPRWDCTPGDAPLLSVKHASNVALEARLAATTSRMGAAHRPQRGATP
jgi:hypothetical protein